jgi:UDP-N-acetylglucosamine 2-epimerase (non-hydrolysing)
MMHNRVNPKKKVAVIIGTRPEAIKMAPVIRALNESEHFQAVTCSTGQHRELLDNALSFFDIKPDIDLNLMRQNQDLSQVASGCLTTLKRVFDELKPSIVLVQGDTTTAFAAGLAAFYSKVPVGHVEAGLRTWDKMAPYPEEVYRRMLSELADFHFAPTRRAVQNLKAEQCDEGAIYLTGNTGIDALLWASEKVAPRPDFSSLFEGKKLILMTAHRRENFGEPLEKILATVRTFAEKSPDFHIVYPVHPNPNVLEPAHRLLGGINNVSLLPPVGYSDLVYLLTRCHLVLTDSGGLQEESPTFGKPVLVLRETTERPEAVDAGCAKLVGSDPEKILGSLAELSSTDTPMYRHMASRTNPFGDGTAAQKIVKILEDELSRDNIDGTPCSFWDRNRNPKARAVILPSV